MDHPDINLAGAMSACGPSLLALALAALLSVSHSPAGEVISTEMRNHSADLSASNPPPGSFSTAGDALCQLSASSSLALLSITTDPENLFSPDKGIYVHPLERGAKWERPVTLEIFKPGETHGVRVDCGLRIHGSMSRRPEESPKHSFRLLFKRQYGQVTLRFPLFGADGPQGFEELILRAGGNDSWLSSNGTERHRALYLRDEWMRRTMRAMGYPAARGIFVHLCLNGHYWGVYNLCEAPGAAESTAAAGPQVTGFDFRKGSELKSGDSSAWDKMMALANSGLTEERHYETISQQLDLTEFVDYLILNFYAGNSDWDRSANWYATRPRTPAGQFRFLVWDAEATLGEPDANTLNLDDDGSPPGLFHRLAENATFRELFATRVQRLLFGDGPLTPAASAERLRSLATSLDPAMVAEAARWGTYRQDVHQYKTGPYEYYTVKEHWQPELARVLNRYFPPRRDILVGQLRERGLYPPHGVQRTRE